MADDSRTSFGLEFTTKQLQKGQTCSALLDSRQNTACPNVLGKLQVKRLKIFNEVSACKSAAEHVSF